MLLVPLLWDGCPLSPWQQVGADTPETGEYTLGLFSFVCAGNANERKPFEAALLLPFLTVP
ncbi:MAG: hypothetical protein ACJAZO_000861, partial [Myxococcota bacterium]